MKSFHICAIVLLLGLVAFKPWRTVNRAVGIPSVADSVSLAGRMSDSVLITQPLTVLLPQSTVDTLVAQVNAKDSIKKALETKSHKLDKTIASLKKSNAEKQSSLVSEQEIENLLVKQNRKQGEPETESAGDKPPK